MKVIFLLIVAFAAVRIDASETCKRKLDVAFLVDGSTSICPTTDPCPLWYSILQLCKDIVDSLDIGFNETRVAFVAMNDDAEVIWNLDTYTNKTSLFTAIDNVPYLGGELETLLSLASFSKIITDVFNPLNGDRPNVQNMKIVISDGAPNFPPQIWLDESIAVQTSRDVIIFAVGLTPGCTEELAKDVASYAEKANETYFLIDDNFPIDEVKDPLVKSMCTYETTLAKISKKLSGSQKNV